MTGSRFLVGLQVAAVCWCLLCAKNIFKLLLTGCYCLSWGLRSTWVYACYACRRLTTPLRLWPFPNRTWQSQCWLEAGNHPWLFGLVFKTMYIHQHKSTIYDVTWCYKFFFFYVSLTTNWTKHQDITVRSVPRKTIQNKPKSWRFTLDALLQNHYDYKPI